MPKWKFWESEKTNPDLPPEPDRSRFGLKPRTDLAHRIPVADPEAAERLARLSRRRNAVLFDVEQSELAASPENPWLQRVALIDQALAAVTADRERIAGSREPAGQPVPPIPITGIAIDSGPPPSVEFLVNDERFRFSEEVDWAERGFQIARSELIHRDGEIRNALSGSDASNEELVEHLNASLFVLATDLRDRALAEHPLPDHVTLADLARPDNENGGWLDWLGHSPAAASKQVRLREIDAEEQRLLTERARELEDMARIADRLPIAQRRLADVDQEIAALEGRQ